MLSSGQKHKYNLISFFYALGGLCAVAAMLVWPHETLQGARYGLELWATILIPALLPFFIIAEILFSLGVVKMLGVLVEPLMRPLFNLPGSASLVIAMGFTSGFPMGAVLTRRLYEEKLCSGSEAERLVAFTNNSSPLFIMAAVAVGMFDNTLLGLILVIAHYLSNIIIGVLLGLFSARPNRPTHCHPITTGNLLIKSVKVLLSEQTFRKPLAQMLGDSVRAGINNITLIGGFVIIFAVLIRLLTAAGITERIADLFAVLIGLCGYSPAIGPAFTVGFWEMTLGLRELSFPFLSLTEKAVAASIILGWSGLSIQAQVTSVLAGSGIRPRLYHWGRVWQGTLAGLLACFLTKTAPFWANHLSLPAFSVTYYGDTLAAIMFNFSNFIPFILKTCALSLLLMIVISLAVHLKKSIA